MILGLFWSVVRPHLFYWILAVGAFVAVHAWLKEHDRRLLVETQVKALQEQIDNRDDDAQKQVQVIVKEVAAAKTPEQQVAEIPRISDVPLNIKLLPLEVNQPPTAQVDLEPLMLELSQCKQKDILLDACQADMVDLEQQVKVVAKKPGFWHRVGSAAKKIGIGAAIGAGLIIALHR